MRTFVQKPKATQQTTIYGRAHFGQSREVNSMLQLPRMIGNETVQRMLQTTPEEFEAGSASTTSPLFRHDFSRIPIHAPHALNMGRTNDASERDAEDAACAVVPGRARRSRRTDPLDGASAPRAVYDMLSLPGRPLAPAVRTALQPRFQTDLSSVRVHDDERAAESARAVRANAYTVGRDIVFGTKRYQPSSLEGQGLIAHELTHVDQQAAAGMSVQRDQVEEAVDEPPMDLDAIFEALEKENKKPIAPKRREKLRQWAAEYEKKIGKRVDLNTMRHVLTRWLMHGSLPEIKTAAEVEAEKFKPPVPCNEIIPYKVGTKLLVTHLLDKVLPPDKVDVVKKLAGEKEGDASKAEAKKKEEKPKERDLEDIIRAHPSAVFDLIMSKDVPKSATAVITESGPELVKATVEVPAIPSKGDLPAYEAFTATMSLEFDTFMGRGYDLSFTRKTAGGETAAFSMRGLQVSKTGEGIQVSVGKDDYFKVKIAKGQDGNLKLQVFEIHTLAKVLLGLDDPLTLVNVVPTGEQPAEVKKKEEEVRSKYKAPPAVNRPQIVGGTGFQWTDRPEALLSLGWKFTFSPGLGILQVPLVFQLDYAPRADFFGAIYTGVEGTIPSQVPVTLSVIGGARAGSIEAQGPEGGPGPRVPVGGPIWGAGVGVQLAQPVNLQLDTSLMLNVLQFGTGQGPVVIPTVGLKTNVKF